MSAYDRSRNRSTDNLGRERIASEEGYFQGMLKSTDARKGTSILWFFGSGGGARVRGRCSLSEGSTGQCGKGHIPSGFVTYCLQGFVLNSNYAFLCKLRSALVKFSMFLCLVTLP